MTFRPPPGGGILSVEDLSRVSWKLIAEPESLKNVKDVELTVNK